MFKIWSDFKEPVLLKDGTSLKRKVDFLESILPNVKESCKEEIKKQINLLKYGLVGEEHIKYELMNSHIPMYVLHDIHLEADGMNAQIDYVIATRSGIYIVECKNLYGNITIDRNGNFIREYGWNGKKIKEGIYSPITQNERHLEFIKYLVMKKNNIIWKNLLQKFFYDTYKSIIVLSNSKTVLNAYYARKEIKDKVIRCDQLINYLKCQEKSSKNRFSDKEMREYAESFLQYEREEKDDFEEKYKKYLKEVPFALKEINQTRDKELRNKLREFRVHQSKLEKVPPYYIFNDEVLEMLVNHKPKTKEQFLNIRGLGECKWNKYGTTIIQLMVDEEEEII